MPECNSKLSADFANECGHRPKQGVNKKWYINWEDIDKAATTKANRGTKVTALVLNEDAKIYPALGTDKTSSVSHALAIGDYSNGYIHTDKYTILYNGETQRERRQELADGARVVTISEKIDTGLAGELSYEIAGLESGMVITEDNYSSSENSGVVNITCATKEKEEESTGLKLFLMTAGLAATKQWITDNEYVAAP